MIVVSDTTPLITLMKIGHQIFFFILLRKNGILIKK